VIDLKRYSCDVIHEKNKILVSFPLENLDLSKYILGYNKNIYLYDLYGVCNHIGLNNNSGHYNSFIKNVDEWYQFDDTNIVKITNLNDIVNPNAYCFFYRRKN
jgi:ubiquitin C-terminal hydrolase